MNSQDFPNLWRWIEVINQRDQGLLLIAMIALFVVAWLWVARFIFQRFPLLPAFRWLIAGAFYVSLALVVLGVIK